MSVVVGLVTEGRNDQTVLMAVVKTVLTRAGRTVAFQPLQPLSDRSTAGHAGWTRVHQWCSRNDPNARDFLIFGGGSGEAPCAALIVQLDGDILNAHESKGPPVPYPPWAGDFRAEYVEAILEDWLWPERTAYPMDRRHIIVVPVWKTETWLAAAVDERLQEPEEKNLDPHLIKLCPKLEDRGNPGRLRKRGVAKDYERLATSLAKNLDTVRMRCRQFNRFCARLADLAASAS